MNMTLQDFLMRLFLLGAGGFCAAVSVCLAVGWIRSFLDRRRKFQCRICGFRSNMP